MRIRQYLAKYGIFWSLDGDLITFCVPSQLYAKIFISRTCIEVNFVDELLYCVFRMHQWSMSSSYCWYGTFFILFFLFQGRGIFLSHAPIFLDGFIGKMAIFILGICMASSVDSLCSINLTKVYGPLSFYVRIGSYLAINPKSVIFTRQAV